MKILITGATGYLGKHLIKDLVKEHRIIALVRSTSHTAFLESLGVEKYNGDITEKDSLNALGNIDFDAVIHLAVSLFPESDRSVNVDGLNNILQLVEKKNIQRFIYISSSLVYGPGKDEKKIKEEENCFPNMKFSRQQIIGEKFCLDAFKKSKLPIVILRPSEIIGGEGGYFFNEYLKGIEKRKIPMIGRGLNRISMTHINDLIYSIKKSLVEPEAIGQIFNINIPNTIRVKDLNKFLCENLSSPLPIVLPKPIAFIASIITSSIFGLLKKTPPLNLDIFKVGTMDGPERDITKAARILSIKPEYLEIREAIKSSYF